MYYAGIDYHKRYSFVSIQDEKGAMVLERQVPYNNPLVFEEIFRQIGGRGHGGLRVRVELDLAV